MYQTRICPKCSNNMLVKNVGNINIDLCTNCKGIFFDYEELGIVLKIIKKPSEEFINEKGNPSDYENEQIRKCASCNTEMTKGIYGYDSGILIDTCPNCNGVFLDDFELAKIKSYLTSPGVDMAPYSAGDKARCTPYENADTEFAKINSGINTFRMFIDPKGYARDRILDFFIGI